MPKTDGKMLADIVDFPGHKASSAGEILNRNGKVVAQRQSSGGAAMVDLRRNGRRHTRLVAPLILRAFTGDPMPDEYQPKHLNGDLTDCRLENLAWTNR